MADPSPDTAPPVHSRKSRRCDQERVARAQLSELINRVGFGKEGIILTRHGKPLVALVPAEFLDQDEGGAAAGSTVLDISSQASAPGSTHLTIAPESAHPRQACSVTAGPAGPSSRREDAAGGSARQRCQLGKALGAANRQKGWPSGSNITRTLSCGCTSATTAP